MKAMWLYVIKTIRDDKRIEEYIVSDDLNKVLDEYLKPDRQAERTEIEHVSRLVPIVRIL